MQTTVHVFAKFSFEGEPGKPGFIRFTTCPEEIGEEENFLGYCTIPFDPFERGLTQDELMQLINRLGLVTPARIMQGAMDLVGEP